VYLEDLLGRVDELYRVVVERADNAGESTLTQRPCLTDQHPPGYR
jgi:hypothetical protein